MKYYAHTKDGCSEKDWQPLEEHLKNVGRLCSRFSAAWCTTAFSNNLGLLHDIGKYQQDFQRRLRDPSIKIEHAFCGAKESRAYAMPGADYCIAGHHGGLPDIGTVTDRADENTLQARLKRVAQDYSAYRSEVSPERIVSNPLLLPQARDIVSAKKQFAFWIRMMFSSLVDADFLDTERFCNEKERIFSDADFSKMLLVLNEKLSSFPCKTSVQKARNTLLKQALSHHEDNAQIFTMNMPTGSGKTLASIDLALELVKKHNLKRVIYVIPYTSIIEQNAQIFRSIFGEDTVLEHHCNFDYDSLENADTAQKLALASENWDSPVIVTTNVQFFESIYGNKPSQMRKLHNIAQSVIVFDEAHMFPALFYQPCLEAIKLLVQDYGCKALLLSATMPDFRKWLDEFGCDGLNVCDVISDKTVFKTFERCVVEDSGSVSTEELISKATSHTSALIVVNTRKAARELYNRLSGRKYHLSTYMTKLDRNRIFSQVKEALRQGEPFVLVSTSLIEAGVDLDFEAVFRERAGIDNILQTAGRCNREGKRDSEKSRTYVFDFKEEDLRTKDKHMLTKQYVCTEVMRDFGTSDKAIRAYFDKIFTYGKETMSEYDFVKFITPTGFNFASYAEKFKLIDDAGHSVIVLYPDDAAQKDIIAELAQDGRKAKRKLQQYTVSLREYEFKKLSEQGVISERDGLYFLTNFSYYDPGTGICLSDNNTYIF